MNHRTAAAIAAVAIGASIIVTPTPTHAQDRRQCVSVREYRGAWKKDPGDPAGVVLSHGWTRHQLEDRWDVRGLGFPIQPAIDPHKYGLTGPVVSIGYPRCGFSTQAAWFGASYQKHGRHEMVATHTWRVDGSRATHGPESH